MIRILKTWIPRLLFIALLIYAGNRWGIPLYKQYMTPKKISTFVPTSTVKSGAFVDSFHEMGTVQAEKSVFVTCPINGKIITMVDDGAVVKAGATIATLDITELETQARSQKLNYENVKADSDRAKSEVDMLKASNKTDIDQSQADLDFAKSEVDRAQKTLEKKQRLADDKLIPKSEIEDAEFQLRSKQLDVRKREMSMELKKREVQSKETQKDADIRNVNFRTDMAKMSYDEAVGRLKSSILKAPAGGLIVLSKNWTPDGLRKIQPGDTLNPQQSVCEIPDLTSMEVKVAVGEGDAPKVLKGMKTRIKLEAVPNKTYTGSVKDISSLATEGRPWDTGSTPGKKTFEVIIKVDQVDPKTLKPGMTADVEFISNQVGSALFVPMESVFEREGATWVFVKNGPDFKKTKVRTGLQNDSYVVLTSGVSKGQTVSLIDPAKRAETKQSDKPETENGNGKKSVPIPDAKAK